MPHTIVIILHSSTGRLGHLWDIAVTAHGSWDVAHTNTPSTQQPVPGYSRTLTLKVMGDVVTRITLTRGTFSILSGKS